MTFDMGIYVVYDREAEESGPIFESKNDSVAIRNYKQVLDRTIYKAEFKLLCLGTINHETNKISLFPEPREIIWNYDELVEVAK